MRQNRISKWLLTGAALAAIAGFSTTASAASISGKWRGSGVATLQSGGKERVRCQVTYGRIAGQDFSLSARCASGAGRLNQVGKLTRIASGKYSGSVTNQEYSIRARVVVTVNGKNQNVTITSSQGSAVLKLSRR